MSQKTIQLLRCVDIVDRQCMDLGNMSIFPSVIIVVVRYQNLSYNMIYLIIWWFLLGLDFIPLAYIKWNSDILIRLKPMRRFFSIIFSLTPIRESYVVGGVSRFPNSVHLEKDLYSPTFPKTVVTLKIMHPISQLVISSIVYGCNKF